MSKTTIQPKDFVSIQKPFQLVTNPEADLAVFCQPQINLEQNETLHQVWLLKEGRQELIGAYQRPPLYDWFDAEWLFFAYCVDKKWYVDKLNVLTRESQRIFSTNYPLLRIDYLYAGKLLIQTKIKEQSPTTIYQKTTQVSQANFSAFQRLPFYHNEGGYFDGKTPGLAIIDFEEQAFYELSAADFEVNSYQFDPVQQKLYYSGQSLRPVRAKNDTLYVYDFKDRQQEAVLVESDLDIKKIIIQEGVFVLGSTYEEYGYIELPNLYQVQQQTAHCVQTLDLDFVLGDARQQEYFLVLDRFVTKVYRWDDAQITTTELPFSGIINEWSGNQEVVYFIGNQKDRLTEVFKYNLQTQRIEQVTDIHRVFHEHRTIAPSNLLDSIIDAWVVAPIEVDPAKQYPAILYIHGGPHGAFNDGFDFNVQLLANAGYYVIYANPTGSSGRGKAFAELREQTGKLDFEELKTVLHQVVATTPTIDAKRLGVTGISYGGYLTNWMISQLPDFKAAISENGVSNWVSQALTSDMGFDYVQHYSGDPLVDVTIPWEQSPLKYAENIEASVLFIHSDLDYRCPIGESIQLFSQLKKRQLDTEMIVYHGENHGISRNGKPHNRLHRYEQVLYWFKHKL